MLQSTVHSVSTLRVRVIVRQRYTVVVISLSLPRMEVECARVYWWKINDRWRGVVAAARDCCTGRRRRSPFKTDGSDSRVPIKIFLSRIADSVFGSKNVQNVFPTGVYTINIKTRPINEFSELKITFDGASAADFRPTPLARKFPTIRREKLYSWSTADKAKCHSIRALDKTAIIGLRL